jgi:hypothetical protein
MSTHPTPAATLDRILTAQLAVAWAGEAGEDRRLGWWRTDLVSEFGGEDLFRRLLPGTWRWAVLQGAREAARRRDAAGRAQEHDADRLLSLFRLGEAIDERLDERLRDLKRSGQSPTDALPGLREVVTETWDRAAFERWVRAHGNAEAAIMPAGRRLKGDVPASLELRIEKLVAALDPVGPEYPLPHFRVAA